MDERFTMEKVGDDNDEEDEEEEATEMGAWQVLLNERKFAQ